MDPSYNSALVLLSVAVSAFGAFTGFALTSRMQCATGAAFQLWLIGAAIALGGGAIWSMHFVAMLAMDLGAMQVRYDVTLTVVSLGLAIGFTALGSWLLAREGPRAILLPLAGTLMGCGVAAMHYTGMAAMHVAAHISYDPVLVAASIVIAVLASTAALWLLQIVRNGWSTFFGSLVMAAAVAGMHYTGMAAAEYGPNHATGTSLDALNGLISSSGMAILVSAATVAVLLIGLVAALVDKRLSDRAKRELDRLSEVVADGARWRAILDRVPQMIWSMDGDGTDEYYNAEWLEFSGISLNARAGRTRIDLVHPDDKAEAALRWQESASSGTEYQAEYRLRHHSGEYRWVLSRGRPDRDVNGRIVRWYGTVVDIHDRKCAELALKQSEALHRTMLEASADCIKVISVDGRVELMNAPGIAAMEIDGFEAIRGQDWCSLWPAEYQKIVHAAVRRANKGKPARFSAFCPTAKGKARWWDVLVTPMKGEDGKVERLLSISRDVSADRNASKRLRQVSERDALTKLPNRRSFQMRLNAAILRAMERGTHVGLLLLDLDHFKNVNDTLGHAGGDHLLKTFGQRLRRCLRANDFVARLGGDEFALIVEGVECDADLAAFGKSTLDRLRSPISYEGRTINGSASIGGALFPRDAASANELLKIADTALYAMKSEGRGGTKMFRSYMSEHAQRISRQLAQARAVVSSNSIVPYYQPKVDLASRRVGGFEALLRWEHAGSGIQTSENIAEGFKDYELASKIGEVMQTAVLADMRAWCDAGVKFGHVSINAAPAEFLRDDYAERLLGLISDAGIPASLLQIEVTEHVFFERGAEHVSRALRKLAEKGVRIALDDFGTGYSSLSHLKVFPVDVLKIDQSFVSHVDTNAESAAIVSAVIDLARNLSIDVVAEGVETEKQARLLIDRKCQYAQGYLFGKAGPAECVADLLSRHDKDGLKELRRVA